MPNPISTEASTFFTPFSFEQPDVPEFPGNITQLGTIHWHYGVAYKRDEVATFSNDRVYDLIGAFITHHDAKRFFNHLSTSDRNVCEIVRITYA